MTDGSGAALEQNSYDSFGNRTNTSFSSRYQYTGREYDSFSGLYYYRARWYDSKGGRFVSQDPIRFRGGDVNLYSYVRNEPLNRKDPTGLIDPSIFQDPRIYDTRTRCRGQAPPYIPILAETGQVGNSCQDQGWRAEGAKFPNGDPRGGADVYGGAYRHCVATCYLKRRYGPFGGMARSIWDWAHEDVNDENSRGDMAGEDAGERAADQCGSCEDNCLKSYPNR